MGIVQAFEFTFELGWKTLKDYLAEQAVKAAFPRDVIKESVRYELIDDGEAWLDMLEKRNLLAHTYDEVRAEQADSLIRQHYFPAIRQVHGKLLELATQ